MTETPSPISGDADANSNFIFAGFGRACDAVEAEVRPEVEEKYAKEWNSSGIIKRWRMRRLIEREVLERVSERLKHISNDSMF